MIPPPKEYTIEKAEFDEVVDFIRFWTTAFRNGCSEKDRQRLSHVNEILDTVRSRPHPAPTIDEPEQLLAEMREQAYNEGARQAREDVLKEIEPVLEHVEALCDEIVEKQDPQSRWGFNSLLIKNKIKSLRTTTPQSEQEHGGGRG